MELTKDDEIFLNIVEILEEDIKYDEFLLQNNYVVELKVDKNMPNRRMTEYEVERKKQALKDLKDLYWKIGE
jgi:hypothetical protein